ncbi:SpoIIE family protein phosphatase [Terrabacter sp. NPDC080008]|uniref:GAF domain-containing SpoIIE family protein phosphatase n=1 Tax=Terrabacter sp. NPDC080008 TaxID=3155176 RepID=UPI00344E7EDE
MNVPWQTPEADRSVVSPRLAALARIAAQVAAATTMSDLTETITQRASTVMGASRSVLAVRDGESHLRTIATHGMSPADARDWDDLILSERSPLAEAVRTNRVVSIHSRADLLARYPELDDGTERSSVTFPLISRASGEAVGALGFRFDGRVGPVDPDLLWVLGVLSDVCAQTMLRLRAEEESHARTAQLQFLADASQALATSLDYRQTLRQVASLAVPAHADWCSVQLVDDGVLRTLALAHVDPAKVQLARELETRWPPDPDRPGSAAEVVRTGKSLLVESITDAMLVAAAHDEEHLRLARELGLCSAMSVPLIAKDRALGVLSFVSAESGRHYTPQDVAFAEDLGRRAGLAIDNADLYSQTRRVAAVLQATLLPQDLPELEGWQVGTVYRQSGRTDVGGDYYDVTGLPGGRVVVVLGDVMGRGVDAAVAGSYMRSAAKVLATQDPQPEALARAMDRFMSADPPTQMASSVYLLFDPAHDDVSLVRAGHPPPLLVHEGRARFLTELGSPVHGLGEVPRDAAHTSFGVGDVLLLYTDGLVERRGESIETGLSRLKAASEELLTGLDDDTDLDVVLETLAEVVSDPDRHDDVAVLAFRRMV